MTTEFEEASDPLRTRVTGVLASYGLELFDLQFRRESIGWVLRVMIDRPWRPRAGDEDPRGADRTAPLPEELVSVEDCSRVSQDLSAILDVEPELVGGPDRSYTLEVSSPGLDRPLRGASDYERFRGRLAKLVTSAPVGGQTSFEGHLDGLDGTDVLVVQGRKVHRIPLAAIKRARLEVEF